MNDEYINEPLFPWARRISHWRMPARTGKSRKLYSCIWRRRATHKPVMYSGLMPTLKDVVKHQLKPRINSRLISSTHTITDDCRQLYWIIHILYNLDRRHALLVRGVKLSRQICRFNDCGINQTISINSAWSRKPSIISR